MNCRRRLLAVVFYFSLAVFAAVAVGSEVNIEWQPQVSGVTVSLRGLSVVDGDVVWASGAAGTVLRTVDGGKTWQDVSIVGAAELDFRDIEAFNAREAVVLSAGSPASSFRTENGGKTWVEVFRDDRPGIFFDAMAFFDRAKGLAFSDPIEGHLVLMTTIDGGRHWTLKPPADCPAALDAEAGFAASGTCLAVHGKRLAWIGLGGATGPGSKARILLTNDGGNSWSAASTPLRSGESRGVFSLAFFDEHRGIAVGGDYTDSGNATDVAAYTTDGGQSWQLVDRGPSGYRSAVAVIATAEHGGKPFTCIAVGKNGADLSDDGGRTWRRIGEEPFQSVAAARHGKRAWAVGAEGVIARMDFKP